MHRSNQKSDCISKESEAPTTHENTSLSWQCLNRTPHAPTLQDCCTVVVYAIARTDTVIAKLASATSSNLLGTNDSSVLWISFGSIAIAVHPIHQDSSSEMNANPSLLRNANGSAKSTTHFEQFDAIVKELFSETNALPVRYGMQLSLSELQSVAASRSELFLTQLESIKDHCEVAVRWLLPTAIVQKTLLQDEINAPWKLVQKSSTTVPSKGSAYLVQKAARSKLLSQSRTLAQQMGSEIQKHFHRFDGPNPIKAIQVNSRMLSEWNPTGTILADNPLFPKQTLAPECAMDNAMQPEAVNMRSEEMDEEQIIVSLNLLVHHAWLDRVKEKAESTRIADLSPIVITAPLPPYSFVSTNDK